MIKEEWRNVNIPKFYEWYLVSNTGKIYSCHKNKVLSPKISNAGYLRITLCDGAGYHRTFGIHRLVALTFIPNPENKPTVNHRDENKTNNHVGNLEWMTNAEQNIYGSRIERARSHTDYNSRGINYQEVARKHDYLRPDMCNRKRCAVYKDDVLIGEYPTQKEAGEAVGVSKGNVSQCISGKKKACKGYEFFNV